MRDRSRMGEMLEYETIGMIVEALSSMFKEQCDFSTSMDACTLNAEAANG